MRRFFLVVVGMALAAVALSQAPFTIVRPVDGSRVREVVKVTFPKNSKPASGYIGIWINGKFLEAVVPDASGDYLVYYLDTKKRGIPDGEMTLEAVLYEDLDTRSVVRDRSSVKVIVDNHTSIKVPASGLSIRYKFTPGVSYYYSVESRDSISSISESQLARGGRAAELPLDSEKYRHLLAIDQVFKTKTSTEALIRMQLLPKRGSVKLSDGMVMPYDYATLALPEGKRKVYADEMASVYMRITDRGREVFSGASPTYTMAGMTGSSGGMRVWAVIPLPVLPQKPVKPGDTWGGPIVAGLISQDQIFSTNKFTFNIPSRGELLGVEWQSGMPCAKIRTSLSFDPSKGPGLARMSGGPEQRVELEELVWFALDKGVPVRIELNITQDFKGQQVPDLGQFLGPRGGGGGNNNMGGPPGDQDDGFFTGPTVFRQQEMGRGRRGGGGGGGFQEEGGGGFRPGRSGGGNAGGGGQFVRIRMQQVYVLEK